MLRKRRFQATHWGHSKHDIRLRNEMVPKQDEASWSKEMNQFIRLHFNVGKTIPAAFVDSHYMDKDPMEKEALVKSGKLLRDMVLSIANVGDYERLHNCAELSS